MTQASGDRPRPSGASTPGGFDSNTRGAGTAAAGRVLCFWPLTTISWGEENCPDQRSEAVERPATAVSFALSYGCKSSHPHALCPPRPEIAKSGSRDSPQKTHRWFSVAKTVSGYLGRARDLSESPGRRSV